MPKESDTPRTDAAVERAEAKLLRNGVSGMEFWREMYGAMLLHARILEISPDDGKRFAAAFVHACDDENTYFGREADYHAAKLLLDHA